MRLGKTWIIIFFLFFLHCHFVYCQNVNYSNDILIIVNQSLSNLKIKTSQPEKYRDTNRLAEVRKNLNRIDGLLNGLIGNVVNRSGVTEQGARKQLLLEIGNYRDLFDLSIKFNSLDSVNYYLLFVFDDLKLKFAGDWGSSTNISNDFIEVHVRVLSSQTNRELPGYLAHVKPRCSVNPIQILNFNPTNQAVKNILPGDKIFWIEKDGNLIAKREEGIEITESGKAEVVFTIN